MLYTFVVATLVASASAFNGPMAARPSASRAAVSMDGSWRGSPDDRGSFARCGRPGHQRRDGRHVGAGGVQVHGV